MLIRIIEVDHKVIMSVNKRGKNRFCHCRWQGCEMLRNKLVKHSASSHVWSDKIIRFQFPIRNPDSMSVNKLAFYKSLCLHVLSNDNIKKVPAEIFLYPHHFPISLLEWHGRQDINQHFTKPLLLSDAKMLDGLNNGSQSLYDNSNTIAYYCKKGTGAYKKLSPRKLNELKFRREYIKSPLTLHHEVESYVSMCRANDVIEPANLDITDDEGNDILQT